MSKSRKWYLNKNELLLVRKKVNWKFLNCIFFDSKKQNKILEIIFQQHSTNCSTTRLWSRVRTPHTLPHFSSPVPPPTTTACLPASLSSSAASPCSREDLGTTTGTDPTSRPPLACWQTPFHSPENSTSATSHATPSSHQPALSLTPSLCLKRFLLLLSLRCGCVNSEFF